jgi:hypothetical protein
MNASLRYSLRSVTAAVSAMLVCPESALAWGCEGHEVVALIAQKHLGKKAARQVRKILKSEPADSCGVADLGLLVKVAKWADDVRDAATGSWHFLNIPLSAVTGNAGGFCPDAGCVTRAIQEQLDTLSTSTDKEERAAALMFVVHFVGDLHQPLHVATNNDRGANCVPITFFDAKPTIQKDTENVSGNLHGLWDTLLVRRTISGHTQPLTSDVLAEFATQLDNGFSARMDSWKQGDIEKWAADAHQKAVSVAYGDLSPHVPTEPQQQEGNQCAQHNHISVRLAQLDIKLAQPYATAAEPVIKEQLAKAGIRLAVLLNQVWPD